MEPLLHQAAAELGVTIEENPDLSCTAHYNCDNNTIEIRPYLPRRVRRCAIAHELGHARYGHTYSTPKAELQANRYAAQLLINVDDYREAELLYGENVNKLAYELDVTPTLVDTFQRHSPYLN